MTRLVGDLAECRAQLTDRGSDIASLGRNLETERQRSESLVSALTELTDDRARLLRELDDLRSVSPRPISLPAPQQLPRAQRRQLEREQRRRH